MPPRVDFPFLRLLARGLRPPGVSHFTCTRTRGVTETAAKPFSLWKTTTGGVMLLWLLVLLLVIFAIAGGAAVSNFLWLLLIVAVVVAVFALISGRSAA
jgi:predicted lipid-binding transport protein (Tim44 family)